MVLMYLVLLGSLSGQSFSVSKVTDGLSRTITNRDSQLILLGGLIGSGIASKYDQTFQIDVQSNGLIPNGMSKLGDYWGIGGQLLLWGSFLNLLDREKRFEYAANAFLANGFITYSLKFAIGRDRPDKSNRRSFPSGHTSNSFLTATIAQEVYGSKAGIPAYVLACVTGLSRIHDDKHYLSDVIFGAALGIAVGKGFGKVYHDNQNPKIGIIPGDQQLQINLVWLL